MEPTTAGATAGAVELLELLHDLSGRAVLAGQHNQPVHGSEWSRWAAVTGGATPALWGQDIGFSAPGTLDGVDRRDANVAEAIAWHRLGAVITYTWHAVCPVDDEPVEFEGGVLRPFARADFEAVLDPGSTLHRRWLGHVDVAAAVLRRLQDAGVPVLWRPYHEMNGPWFWWGGQPDLFVRLWRQVRERLVDHHGLRNLVWVWSPNSAYGSAGPFAPFFPGHDVVDALAVDTYGGHWEREHHDALLDLADGRPIGLGEVGELPPPELFAEQPRWCWFMGWPDIVATANTPEQVRALYSAPRTVALDRLPRWRTRPDVSAGCIPRPPPVRCR